MANPLLSLALAQRVKALEQRNKELNRDLFYCRSACGKWREKATKRRDQLRVLRRRVQRLEARLPGAPPTYTKQQWREHERILERIRQIPDREP